MSQIQDKSISATIRTPPSKRNPLKRNLKARAAELLTSLQLKQRPENMYGITAGKEVKLSYISLKSSL